MILNLTSYSKPMNNPLHVYLNECARQYYQGNPILSDNAFDRLAESSNYNVVGAVQHEHIQQHYYPMYSLQKFYADEGKQNPLAAEKDISYSPKLDGAAISILYIDGSLSRVLSRGDGREGTEITNKFIGNSRIPQSITIPGIVQVTGEIAAPKYIPNARNYAAGALNLKDASEFNTRAVEFFAYNVQPNITDTFEEDMKALKLQGFNTIKDSGLEDVYPTDGIVFRCNNNSRFNELGYTSQFPKGAYAKKERPEGAVTKLLDVLWQVGKTGRVTPVAILEPTMLGDATISRATLNNPGFIEMLDIQIGDMVHIIRSGEIIPTITHKVE
jgi:DNA ligase (NAD+)